MIHPASSLKARGAIQELLATLYVEDLTNCGTKLSNLIWPFVTPHVMTVTTPMADTTRATHPMMRIIIPCPYFSPPPSRLPTQKKKEPKIVLDCTFMTFLCPSTFDNQLFQKDQPPKYTIKEIDAFNNNFRKKLHFNFLVTRMSQKQLESATATQASRLCNVDLGVLLQDNTSILPTKRHKLSSYILEDILDCPVGS
jgi:hypothetical protein